MRKPPYFDGMTLETDAGRRTSPAPACSRSSATRSRPTTSARPARSRRTAPPASYLAEHGVDRKDFNSYGSRRGNHEVMIRGTFANIRLRNQLLDGVEGGYTRDFTAGRRPAVVHLRRERSTTRQQGIPLVILGGKEYGSGSSPRLGGQGHEPARRQGRHHRELRAHPPLEPHRHGRRPAAVPGGRDRRSRSGSTAPRSFASPASTALNEGTHAEDGARDRRRRATHSPEGKQPIEFDAVVRIDTPGEADYYRNGGILQYVLRSLV